MALTDKTDGSRTILEGRNPVKIAVSVAVKVGDLITEAGALADANATTPAPAAYVAGEAGAANAVITAYREALIGNVSGMTVGDKVFLSDTAGGYAAAASATQRQLLGYAISATEMFVRPERMAERFAASLALTGLAAATATNYDKFFVAPMRCRVTKISEVHGTAGTDAGAVTLDVERLQGTEALGAGDALLGATKINLKGTADTVQSPALTATAANLVLEVGDRLAAVDAGVLTAVAGVALTVELEPA